jgi:pimeloyl-ACP methyl ester carboxylesterase
MSTFVLVHGSWHDGSAWNSVIKHLHTKGHEALAPTVAGHGKTAVKGGVDHAKCVQSVVDYIVAHDLSDSVLVGHSFGGTVIAKVAEELTERIRRLVFWNAFIPADGESVDDCVPPLFRSLFAGLVADSPDYSVMLPFPIWREAFINDADIQLAQSSYQLLSSEPYQPLIDKLDLKAFYGLSTPRSFLNATEDIAMPPGEWAWHPRMSSRLGLYRLVQMHGSHEVIFTNPKELAEKLVEAGRD